MKGYTVFNVERIEDLPELYYAKPEVKTTPALRIRHAEEFFRATKADVRFRGAALITLPRPTTSRCRSLRHSATPRASMQRWRSAHWTKHPSRLDRDFGRKHWDDEGDAREELVAELASAFPCADLGITPEVMPDHASYIAKWLTVLKNDKRAIFSAAAHAESRGLPPRPKGYRS
jgi:antirestriction protein ArdC